MGQRGSPENESYYGITFLEGETFKFRVYLRVEVNRKITTIRTPTLRLSRLAISSASVEGMQSEHDHSLSGAWSSGYLDTHSLGPGHRHSSTQAPHRVRKIPSAYSF